MGRVMDKNKFPKFLIKAKLEELIKEEEERINEYEKKRTLIDETIRMYKDSIVEKKLKIIEL